MSAKQLRRDADQTISLQELAEINNVGYSPILQKKSMKIRRKSISDTALFIPFEEKPPDMQKEAGRRYHSSSRGVDYSVRQASPSRGNFNSRLTFSASVRSPDVHRSLSETNQTDDDENLNPWKPQESFLVVCRSPNEAHDANSNIDSERKAKKEKEVLILRRGNSLNYSAGIRIPKKTSKCRTFITVVAIVATLIALSLGIIIWVRDVQSKLRNRVEQRISLLDYSYGPNKMTELNPNLYMFKWVPNKNFTRPSPVGAFILLTTEHKYMKSKDISKRRDQLFEIEDDCLTTKLSQLWSWHEGVNLEIKVDDHRLSKGISDSTSRTTLGRMTQDSSVYSNAVFPPETNLTLSISSNDVIGPYCLLSITTEQDFQSGTAA